ncbi:hypothetical protein MTR67_041035 [Solanum verrucosum]|uniref:Uncharacterized protein n=1 Tax=Solanum verrucosum TaxID=315347 RepID=A0AAF0UJM0_SOLVR|nr:hypothetical protein MTR67_041035 [Solanum verrucosum]
MMKISTTKNVSGIGCVILFGGALITAAAMGSAFFISRKNKKSTKNVTKKEGNEKLEDESSNKGLHFILPEQQLSSSIIRGEIRILSLRVNKFKVSYINETDKLCHNDSTTSLFSIPCLIQDGKPKLDGKRDTLNAIVSDHPKAPSFERLELSETKISLLPNPEQELDEVSRVRIDVIQGNEKIEVLSRVHQAHATIFSNPDLQMDYKREIFVDNDIGESNELQHTGVIETDNLEESLIQEQEKQATGDQETSISNEHEPLNSAFELMKAADEGQCADAETQIDQIAKKSDVRMQFSDEEECAKENDQANSCYEEATSENSPSIDVENLDASAIRNDSIDDEHSAEAYEDEDKGHVQIMHFEEQCATAETQIDQFVKKCDVRIQFSDEKERANKNNQAKSCYEEATSENSHCGTYIMDAQNLAASEIRNASVDDQHSAEVIQVIKEKETNVMDPAASIEQSPEADHSPIQLVEKYSFEQNCQGNVLEEDNEATKRLSMDIEAEKDLEVHSKELKDDIEESVFVYEEKEVEEEDVDDNDNDVDKDDDAHEVEDDILEGARHSYEQSNSDKIWPADSNQELLLEHKVEKMKEEEKGTTIEEENCNLESTQNDGAITSCQQSYDGKDDSTMNVIDNYRTKLMYLNDITAITRRRRVLFGALLALIWYLVLKGIFPSVIGGFKILNQ